MVWFATAEVLIFVAGAGAGVDELSRARPAALSADFVSSVGAQPAFTMSGCPPGSAAICGDYYEVTGGGFAASGGTSQTCYFAGPAYVLGAGPFTTYSIATRCRRIRIERSAPLSASLVCIALNR